MNDNMHISTAGLELIKKFEGFVGHIYKDQASLDTIGYGHLLNNSEKQSGKFAGGLNEADATVLLALDVRITESAIKKYINVQLNQNQFDALTSMLFNTGAGPIITGGLGKALNAGNFSQACTEMMKWCHGPGGVVFPVLQHRRAAEVALFSKNDIKTENIVQPILAITPINPVQIVSVPVNVAIPEQLPSSLLTAENEKLALNWVQKIYSLFLNLFKKK